MILGGLDVECPEPDGNKPVEDGLAALNGGKSTISAHRLMLEETGQCPWCGKEG